MICARNEAPRGLRWGLSSLAAIVVVVAVSTDNADARRKRATSSYSPAYAAIVVDANSGSVMHSASADALRHPASLTKIMTLYMLFERLDAGKLKLDSQFKVTEHAADQSPTKLGLKAGSTISVEDCIKGMVTRSANDAAVVVAENLADSEDDFAEMMTRKARALGMSKTVYQNASGLPDDEQVTTARDQATLGRAIQEHFPRYYKYFQTRSFTFRGQSIGNHNRLLGRVDGVDGIKTGYTRASGFNLVTSVHREGRYVVAVVLGGSSAGSRDARMRDLLDEYVDDASAKRSAPMIAQASPEKASPEPRSAPEPKAAPRPIVAEAAPKPDGKDPQRFNLASSNSAPVRLDPPGTITAAPSPRVAPGSTEPIKPNMVKTLNVKPSGSGSVQTASVLPLPFPGLPRAAEPTTETATARSEMSFAPVGSRPGVLGTLPAPAPARTAAIAAEPAPAPTQVAIAAPASMPTPAKQVARSGWMIQVGAYPEESNAKQQLSSVKSKASRLLAAADPFTESVSKGGTTFYRARFAGLDKDQAEAACKYLKRNDVDCMAIKN
jgi:D-alanyl-D-alanine carboxypeptidase